MRISYIALGLSLLGGVLLLSAQVVKLYERDDARKDAEQAGPIFTYEGKVERIIDGDTISVSIPSFPAPFNPIAVRVAHINAPESRRPAPDCEIEDGRLAKAFAAGRMPAGTTVTIVYDDNRQDKYGRMLARVVLPNGQDYGQALISEGLARAYEGGKKEEWCSDPTS